MKCLMILLIGFVMISCATSGFDIYEKTSACPINIGLQYYSTPIYLNFSGNSHNITSVLNLEMLYCQGNENWMIAIEFLGELNGKIDLNEMIFFLDGEPYPVQNSSIIKGIHKFVIGEDFFKMMIFTKNADLKFLFDEKEFNAEISDQDRINIGLFYRSLKVNVIDNQTIIII